MIGKPEAVQSLEIMATLVQGDEFTTVLAQRGSLEWLKIRGEMGVAG